jgi:putative transposase
MVRYDPKKHHRRSHRMKNYDYSRAGGYYLTMNTQYRKWLFGEVIDGVMQLSEAGKMVERVWRELPERFPGIRLDAWVVMPEHFHGVILIEGEDLGLKKGGDLGLKKGDHEDRPNRQRRGRGAGDFKIGVFDMPRGDPRDRPIGPEDSLGPGSNSSLRPHGTLEGSIGRMIQAFKSITTVEYIAGVKGKGWRSFPGRLWQRDYHDHIVRNQRDLERIRKYIADNPMKWGLKDRKRR